MISRYLKIAAVVAVAGLLGWTAVSLRSGAKAEAQLETTQAVVVAQTQAATVSRGLQARVDKANEDLRKLDAERADVRGRLSAAERRLRDATPTERDYAGATVEALRDYAASLDRDFAECRERYVELGIEAGAAADAARALEQAWPEYGQFNEAVRNFQSQGLK